MTSILQSVLKGGVIIRDEAGNPVQPIGTTVTNGYAPPAGFTIANGPVTASPNSCGFQIAPEQWNALCSELLHLAVQLTPTGTWDLNSLSNLAAAFQSWFASHTSLAADPHPQYTTDTEVDAKVAALRTQLLGGDVSAALDTFFEVASRITTDESALTALTNALAGKQPLDADLTAFAALAPAAGKLLVGAAGGWALLDASGIANDWAFVRDNTAASGFKFASVSGGASQWTTGAGGAISYSGGLVIVTTMEVGSAIYGSSGASGVVNIKSTSGNSNRSGIAIGLGIGGDNGGISLNVAGPTVEWTAVRIQGTTGYVGFNTTSPAARVHAVADAATGIPMIAQGAAGQAANLQEWQNSTGTLLASFSSAGVLTLPNGSYGTPSIRGASSTSGLYFANSGADFVYTRAGSDYVCFGFQKVGLEQSSIIKWGGIGDPSSGYMTGIGRNADGVVEVNNGTAGTYRDLKLRNLIFSDGTTQSTAGGITRAESSQLTMPSAAGWTTFAHGLGVTPKRFGAYAICVTASGDFAVGDTIDFSTDNGYTILTTVAANATSVKFGLSSGTLYAGPSFADIAGSANFKLVLWAEK